MQGHSEASKKQTDALEKGDRSDVNVRSGDQEGKENEGEGGGGENRLSQLPEEESAEAMRFFVDLIRILNVYLEQPLPDLTKVLVLATVYDAVYAKLDQQAARMNISFEEALKMDRQHLQLF